MSEDHDEDVGVLVAAAARGDSLAWGRLVDRYTGLVLSVCRSYRLGEADIADVSQTVWLRLVERLTTLREPRALPGWLVTSTRRESLAVLDRTRRERPSDQPLDDPDVRLDQVQPDVAVDADLLERERDATLRLAFAELPKHCQDLLSLLMTDPPTPYDEISHTLGYSRGCIGPTRSRCLERLRRSPALAAYLGDTNQQDQPERRIP